MGTRSSDEFLRRPLRRSVDYKLHKKDMAKDRFHKPIRSEQTPQVQANSNTEDTLQLQCSGADNPKAHSRHEREVAAYLFSLGIGYTRVAWITGININTLRDWERSYKEGRFNPGFAHRQYDDETKSRGIELRKQGLSLKEIAAEIGCSVTAIRNWLIAAQDSGQIGKTVFSNKEFQN